MSRSAYAKSECWICGKRISTCGFAQFSHRMKHVRQREVAPRTRELRMLEKERRKR